MVKMILGKPLTTGGSNGLKPTIVVTAPTGSTVTCDGITGTEISGTWTFVTTIGSHTVVASLNGQSKTETVLVDDVGIFNVTITYEIDWTDTFSTFDTTRWSKTSTGTITVSNNTLYIAGTANVPARVTTVDTFNGNEKEIDASIVIASETGTYLESRFGIAVNNDYAYLSQTFRSQYSTNNGILTYYESGNKVTHTWSYSYPNARRMLVNFDDMNVKFYCGGNLLRTVSLTKGADEYIGLPYIQLGEELWTAFSMTVSSVSLKVTYY